MISKPGIYTDMSAADYFADPCPAPSLTQSLAKILLDRSPRHAWLASPQLNPKWQHDADGYDKDRIIGSAAHAYMLGRGKQVCVLGQTNFRTKEAQEVRDSCFDAGQIPILPHHDEAARAMVDAALPQLRARGIDLAGGDAEAVIAWNEGGVWCRSMIDWIAEDRCLIVDIKTTGASAAPHALAHKMVDDGWDIQAAMHERGLNVLDPTNAGRRDHLFIAIENFEPFALSVCRISESVMTMGRKKLQAAASLWTRCMKFGAWPPYPAEIVVPEYPGWKETQWLERETAEAERQNMNDNPNVLVAG